MTTFEIRKDLFADERDDTLQVIGQPTIRQDILGHVTGRSPFYDDHLFDGLLHMRCTRSPHHHARVRSIDTSAAERMDGVRRIVLAKDVPYNINTLLSLINFGREDEALIQDKKVAYIGEPVAAVIADTDRQARDAAAAIRVDYEVLPHVLDVEAAIAPDAPVVNEVYPNNTFDYHEIYDHQKTRFGDVEAGFAQADKIIEAEYQMSPIEQAPVETCGAIAMPETNDRFVCYTGTQALFFSLGTTAKLLDTPSSRLHFIGGTAGGGFGGKVDSIVEPMSVLGAMLTGKPVKFMWDRAEEMQVGAPRGAERWRIKDGVLNDGRIVARQFTGFFDAGAYTRLSSYAIIKCAGHLPGPYTIPNVASNIFCVFTNRTPATAMRGFGITGVDFAIECHMDKVAEAVGMDPIELRILNAYRDGDMKAHRRFAKNTALIESCQVAAQKGNWRIRPEFAQDSSLVGGGVGARAEIPETVTDQVGRIGERRSTPIPAEPGAGAAVKGRVPAGTASPAISAAPPQDEDMVMDPARIGHPTGRSAAPSTPSTSASAPTVVSQPTPAQPVYPPQPAPAPAMPAAAPPVPPHQVAASTPATPGRYQPPPQPMPAPTAQPQPAPQAPPQSPAQPVPGTPQPQSPSQQPYQPSEPFQRGVRRPGASPFVSGTRRR